MIQRTKGRLLLAMLVITGLAGTYSDNTLTKDERKTAVKVLKETKVAVLSSADKLTESQLNYRTKAGAWNIRECVYHITLAEKGIWSMLETSLKETPNSLMRDSLKWSDEQIVKMTNDRTVKQTAPDMLQPARASWNNVTDATDEFKSLRNTHIKYVKTTTEDLRNRVIRMPFGYLDAYQLILVLNAHTLRHLQQIEQIKQNPGFPKS